MCLHGRTTGSLLAILDSGWLTGIRSGIGAAIGTDVLASANSNSVGLLGAGAQGRAQIRALATLREIGALTVYDVDRPAAESFAEDVGAALDIGVDVVDSPSTVARKNTIILMATWSTVPLLGPSDVNAGSRLTSLGADKPGKVAIDPALLARALVVTDDRRLAEPVLGHVDTTLSEVLRGEHVGGASESDVTVDSPVGLPMQDCVAAWHIYQQAIAKGLGNRVALEE